MRCFVAIELPPQVHDRLADLQNRLGTVGRAVRWTRVDQIHLTVKFLGDVPDDQVPAVCAAAKEVARRFDPFPLDVRGAGCFPPAGQARIVWAGIAEAPQPLADCQEACEQAYAALGFKPEGRRFHPHLTIGRVRDARASRDIRAAVEKEAAFPAGTFTAGELTVFQSVLRPTGPTYTVIARAPFSPER